MLRDATAAAAASSAAVQAVGKVERAGLDHQQPVGQHHGGRTAWASRDASGATSTASRTADAPTSSKTSTNSTPAAGMSLPISTVASDSCGLQAGG